MYHPPAEANEGRILRAMELATGELRSLLVWFLRTAAWDHRFGHHGGVIAFDTTNHSTVDAHIILIRADGSDRKDLGVGCLPSFSPDGDYLVFSSPNFGVGMMNLDGRPKSH